MIKRIKAAWSLLFNKDFLLVTMENDQWRVINSFPGDRITSSGKAFYLK